MCVLDWRLNQVLCTAVQGAVFCMSYRLEALQFVGWTTKISSVFITLGHLTEDVAFRYTSMHF